MMVEIWLDAVEDPASRTVVMELLMALELPEGKGDEVIELLGIVRTAIETHWKVWSSTFVTEGGASQDIASHASLATSIFEDLPEEEAARYLREAAVSMGVGKS